VPGACTIASALQTSVSLQGSVVSTIPIMIMPLIIITTIVSIIPAIIMTTFVATTVVVPIMPVSTVTVMPAADKQDRAWYSHENHYCALHLKVLVEKVSAMTMR
jgi:hypothetical protein